MANMENCMRHNLSLDEYQAILAGMKRDVTQAITRLFRSPQNVFPEITFNKTIGLDFALVDFETENTHVTLDLAIPFTVERPNERIVKSNSTKIIVTVSRKREQRGSWERDQTIGPQGMVVFTATSFDQDGVDSIAQVLVDFLNTLFEPELAEA
jgi:hypothetical protein